MTFDRPAILQTSIYCLLSILIMLFDKFPKLIVLSINTLYIYLNFYLTQLFSRVGLSGSIAKIILLITIPMVIAAIPAIIYRLIKGQMMPYFFTITWGIWLVIVLSHILTH